MMTKKKLLGILGGMGPQASCELYRLINNKSVNRYRAARNADFPHLLISNIPVPDLISCQDDQDLTISMVRKDAQRLCKAGATDLFMSCNTMHLYADEMFDNVSCEFHSLITLVSEHLKATNAKNVLLLATNTTIKTNLYQRALKSLDIGYVEPSNALLLQSVDMILEAISGQINPDKKNDFYNNIVTEAQAADADVILLACTELPIIVTNTNISGYKVVSSLDILAEAICQIHYDTINMVPCEA